MRSCGFKSHLPQVKNHLSNDRWFFVIQKSYRFLKDYFQIQKYPKAGFGLQRPALGHNISFIGINHINKSYIVTDSKMPLFLLYKGVCLTEMPV